ncbi:hypothetical protein MJG53_004529 [Ovis ammon polii x Ovis aries]|uniref:Uncharacterized protein n=1 Tax=Ovis ammon polii x Ovis aries TaxID=2918886 RepID=A0ACB9VA15_9CETA|nr:hypothetical protein MJG53_004529 [Ovis ammon polii x Ovis aries]
MEAGDARGWGLCLERASGPASRKPGGLGLWGAPEPAVHPGFCQIYQAGLLLEEKQCLSEEQEQYRRMLNRKEKKDRCVNNCLDLSDISQVWMQISKQNTFLALKWAEHKQQNNKGKTGMLDWGNTCRDVGVTRVLSPQAVGSSDSSVSSPSLPFLSEEAWKEAAGGASGGVLLVGSICKPSQKGTPWPDFPVPLLLQSLPFTPSTTSSQAIDAWTSSPPLDSGLGPGFLVAACNPRKAQLRCRVDTFCQLLRYHIFREPR